jgi:IS4 transposase
MGRFCRRCIPRPKRARRHRRRGLRVRVIEYQLDGGGAEADQRVYRLLTTLLDPKQAPAAQLAGLYAQRWEIEGLFDELKTHLRGGRVVLRSKTPELVEQEFYGLLLAHWVVRGLMSEAAQAEGLDPDRLSFTHAVRVVRRKRAAGPTFCPSS